ncbi:hypothetical protein F5B21DRAFT_361081 [Xylaria acuta]|nr:hypothetical protein F5B21DRAFT_361081 [Xylaria acuta]
MKREGRDTQKRVKKGGPIRQTHRKKDGKLGQQMPRGRKTDNWFDSVTANAYKPCVDDGIGIGNVRKGKQEKSSPPLLLLTFIFFSIPTVLLRVGFQGGEDDKMGIVMTFVFYLLHTGCQFVFRLCI